MSYRSNSGFEKNGSLIIVEMKEQSFVIGGGM